jgi:predicted metalloprotease with PDZ domain
MFAILMLVLSFTLLSAQNVVNINGTEIDLAGLEALEELDDMAPGTQNVKIMINKEFNPMVNDGSGYFGIYVEDLSFPKAQKLGYSQMLGVLVTGVVQGSPAWDARLQEEDIIMSINEMPVYNKEEFDRLRKNMRPGDALKLKLWRSGTEVPLEMVLGSRETPSAPGQDGKPTKKRSSVGYGGGGWTPTWLQTDMADVNGL